MAKMPETIKIGCITYTVRLVGSKKLKGFWGRLEKKPQVIKIIQELAPQRRAETLFHEVLHGAYEMANLGQFEEVNEEQVVNGLSLQLVQIFRDNPDLVMYIMEPTE